MVIHARIQEFLTGDRGAGPIARKQLWQRFFLVLQLFINGLFQRKL